MNQGGFESQGDNSGFPGQADQNAGPYKFTPDELRVLNECNKESFFQRCLPLSSIMGLGTWYGVRIGYLKGHTKYGPFPKTAFACFAGYLIGKLSYQTKCADKLMTIPNSKLGQMLRERRRTGKGGFQETLEPGFGTGISLPSSFSLKEEPAETDNVRKNSYLDLNLDDRPQVDYDFQRPPSYDVTNMELSGLPAEPPEHKITYDELRKKNRDDYETQRSKYVRPPAPPPPPQYNPPNYSNPEGQSPSSGAPWSSSQYGN